MKWRDAEEWDTWKDVGLESMFERALTRRGLNAKYCEWDLIVVCRQPLHTPSHDSHISLSETSIVGWVDGIFVQSTEKGGAVKPDDG